MRPPRPLTPAQLEILEVLWTSGEATVAQVWKGLAARGGRPVARNTVLTMLQRLADRGWLSRQDGARAHRYRAEVSREAALGGLAAHLLDSAFHRSISSFLAAILQGRALSAEEAAQLRSMIDAAERRGRTIAGKSDKITT